MSMFVYCPHCQHEQSDCLNGGDVREWWDGQDGEFEAKCDSCKEEFLVRSEWSPSFETEFIEDEDKNDHKK